MTAQCTLAAIFISLLSICQATIPWVQNGWPTISLPGSDWIPEVNNFASEIPDGQYSLVTDPTDSTNQVLSINYQAGNINYDYDLYDGGMIFTGKQLYADDPTEITLTYRVYFPTTFNFQDGGRLPGLYGIDNQPCQGTYASDGSLCFSARMGWRSGGQGEINMYIPYTAQTTRFQGKVIQSGAALSVDRGSWYWTTGTWHTVQQYIKLNTPGVNNGIQTIYINGALVSYNSDILFRTTSDVVITGIFFSSFYTTTAAPANTYTLYKDFSLLAGPVDNTTSSGTLPTTVSTQLSSATFVPCTIDIDYVKTLPNAFRVQLSLTNDVALTAYNVSLFFDNLLTLKGSQSGVPNGYTGPKTGETPGSVFTFRRTGSFAAGTDVSQFYVDFNGAPVAYPTVNYNCV